MSIYLLLLLVVLEDILDLIGEGLKS